jgi:hypothetical protein
MSGLRLTAAILFAGLLSLWTWKLLEPNPVPEQVREMLSWWDWLPFLAAKALHAGGYATLTLLAGIAVPGRRGKRVALAFLLLHGVGTEIGQTFVPNRGGSVRDVLIDWAGIAAGVGLGWHWWREAFLAKDNSECPPIP